MREQTMNLPYLHVFSISFVKHSSRTSCSFEIVFKHSKKQSDGRNLTVPGIDFVSISHPISCLNCGCSLGWPSLWSSRAVAQSRRVADQETPEKPNLNLAAIA